MSDERPRARVCPVSIDDAMAGGLGRAATDPPILPIANGTWTITDAGDSQRHGYYDKRSDRIATQRMLDLEFVGRYNENVAEAIWN